MAVNKQNSWDLIQNFLDNPDMTIVIVDVQGYFKHHTCTYYSLRANDVELNFICQFHNGLQLIERLHFTNFVTPGQNMYWDCQVSRPVAPDTLLCALDAAHARQLKQWPILRAVHSVAHKFPDNIQRNANEYVLNLGGDDCGAPVCCKIDGHNGEVLFCEKTFGCKEGMVRGIYNKHNAGHLNQILSMYKGYPKYFLSVAAKVNTK